MPPGTREWGSAGRSLWLGCRRFGSHPRGSPRAAPLCAGTPQRWGCSPGRAPWQAGRAACTQSQSVSVTGQKAHLCLDRESAKWRAVKEQHILKKTLQCPALDSNYHGKYNGQFNLKGKGSRQIGTGMTAMKSFTKIKATNCKDSEPMRIPVSNGIAMDTNSLTFHTLTGEIDVRG